MNNEVYFSQTVSPICLDLTGNSSKLGIEKNPKSISRKPFLWVGLMVDHKLYNSITITELV
jgi:hypothetical protein